MLKLVIHFNLYKVWGLGWRFFFNLWMSNCPRTIWWKFYLNYVVFADLSKLRHVCGYFYVLYSVPMSMSIPPPLPHRYYYFSYQSVQFSHESYLTLCNPRDCSTPGLFVHHQLPKFTQTHIHRVGDAIQPSHPLSSPSPPAPNPSQHQGLFQWVNSSHEVAKVLELQL